MAPILQARRLRKGKHSLRWVLTVFARLAVTVVLLALILGRVDWEILLQRSLDLSGYAVLLAFLSFLLIAAGEIARMKVTLVAFEFGWTDFMRIHLIGSFFASFLPGQVGADLYRVHSLSRIDGTPDRPVALVLLIRVVGFTVLVAAAFLGIALQEKEFWTMLTPRGAGPALAIVFLVTMLGTLAVSTQPRLRDRLATFRRRSREAARAVTNRQVLSLIVLSVFVLEMRVLVTFFLVLGTSSTLSLDEALLTVTLATLVTLIPISFAGIGLREGAMTALLVYFQVPYEEAVLVAVIGRVFIVLLALTGGFWLMRETAVRGQENTG